MVGLELECVSESPSLSFSRSGVGPKLYIYNTFSDNDAGAGEQIYACNSTAALWHNPYMATA